MSLHCSGSSTATLSLSVGKVHRVRKTPTAPKRPSHITLPSHPNSGGSQVVKRPEVLPEDEDEPHLVSHIRGGV